jgi:hypothetical protein
VSRIPNTLITSSIRLASRNSGESGVGGAAWFGAILTEYLVETAGDLQQRMRLLRVGYCPFAEDLRVEDEPLPIEVGQAEG